METARLKLMPLSVPELELYLSGNNYFELQYGLQTNGRVVAANVKRDVEWGLLRKMKTAIPEHIPYHTFWLAIDKTKNLIVAELGFKGVPDKNGTVEIGYGTMPAYVRNGYMTEAVGGIVSWANMQESVRVVLAETHESNLASQAVLKKNGFIQFKRKQDMLWWRKELR